MVPRTLAVVAFLAAGGCSAGTPTLSQVPAVSASATVPPLPVPVPASGAGLTTGSALPPTAFTDVSPLADGSLLPSGAPGLTLPAPGTAVPVRTAVRGPAACSTAHMSIKITASGLSGGYEGEQHATLVTVTNVGAGPCRLTGFPRRVLLDGAAIRDVPGPGAPPFTLTAGQHGYFDIVSVITNGCANRVAVLAVSVDNSPPVLVPSTDQYDGVLRCPSYPAIVEDYSQY